MPNGEVDPDHRDRGDELHPHSRSEGGPKEEEEEESDDQAGVDEFADEVADHLDDEGVDFERGGEV
jgi:hypothetical protein